MPLIDRGTEVVTIYPAVRTVDPDGNPSFGVSPTGYDVLALVQGLSSEEAWNLGFQTEERYRMFIARPQDTVDIGIGAQAVWAGVRWNVDGEPSLQTGSPRVRHQVYYLKRA